MIIKIGGGTIWRGPPYQKFTADLVLIERQVYWYLTFFKVVIIQNCYPSWGMYWKEWVDMFAPDLVLILKAEYAKY